MKIIRFMQEVNPQTGHTDLYVDMSKKGSEENFVLSSKESYTLFSEALSILEDAMINGVTESAALRLYEICKYMEKVSAELGHYSHDEYFEDEDYYFEEVYSEGELYDEISSAQDFGIVGLQSELEGFEELSKILDGICHTFSGNALKYAFENKESLEHILDGLDDEFKEVVEDIGVLEDYAMLIEDLSIYVSNKLSSNESKQKAAPKVSNNNKHGFPKVSDVGERCLIIYYSNKGCKTNEKMFTLTGIIEYVNERKGYFRILSEHGDCKNEIYVDYDDLCVFEKIEK